MCISAAGTAGRQAHCRPRQQLTRAKPAHAGRRNGVPTRARRERTTPRRATHTAAQTARPENRVPWANKHAATAKQRPWLSCRRRQLSSRSKSEGVMQSQRQQAWQACALYPGPVGAHRPHNALHQLCLWAARLQAASHLEMRGRRRSLVGARHEAPHRQPQCPLGFPVGDPRCRWGLRQGTGRPVQQRHVGAGEQAGRRLAWGRVGVLTSVGPCSRHWQQAGDIQPQGQASSLSGKPLACLATPATDESAAMSIPLPALTAVVSQRVVPRLCVCPAPAAAAGLARLALPCSSGGGCSRRCRLAALQNAAQALPAGRGSATASVCYSVVGLRPRGRYGRPRARQVASPAQSLAPKCSTLG